MNTKIEKIFIHNHVANSPRVQQILDRLPDVSNQLISSTAEIDLILKNSSDPYATSKKYLFLTNHPGKFLQNCPGMNSQYRCCRYLTIDVATNCDLDCTYCVLQSFFKTSLLTLHMNTNDLLNELDHFFSINKDQTYRAGTGEYSDSLSLDHISHFSKDLVPFFGSLHNGILELKTKTNNIQNLEHLSHNRKTIIGWSLNGIEISKKEEFKTASISERIWAAKKCQDWGYPVSFHFDPLFYTPNWKQDLSDTFELLESHIKKDIAWISIGSLRLNPGLKNKIQNRFSKTTIYDGELFPSYDGKLRYLRPIRIEMYQFMKDKITKIWGNKAPYYLCMEPVDVWQESFGWVNNSDHALDLYLQNNRLISI